MRKKEKTRRRKMDVTWTENIENREQKEALAKKMAQRVKEGEVIRIWFW